MSDRDNITLPREVAYQVPLHELLESVPLDARLVIDDADGKGTRFIPVGRLCREAATALRTALAAEPTKQEPVAWVQKWAIDRLTGQMGAVSDPVTWGIDAPLFTCAVHHSVPLYTAPPDAPTVKESLTHPGYVIGSHWLETAYSRICAGEAEADVLRDCGWERVDGIEALRRDAERYNWVLKWLMKNGLLSRERCRIDSPASYGHWWILRKPKVIDGSSLIGYGKTEDAAIDAAMEASTAPASAAADASTAPEDKT